MNNKLLTNKVDIIMLNMSAYADWQSGVVNRNFHVLQNLVKQPEVNKVVAVDFLPLKLKSALKTYWRGVVRGPRSAETVYGDLTTACYRENAKLYIYSSVDSLFSKQTVVKELRKIINKLKLNKPIFWSFNPLFVEHVLSFNHNLQVFDAVDNWAEHSQYLKIMKQDKILANYRHLAEASDEIFTVSESMVEQFRKFGRKNNLRRVANGVDCKHFNDPVKRERQTELDKITRPVIGYLGTVQDRLDFELIAKLAEANQDKTIALCGPIWPNVRNAVQQILGRHENILFTGRVPYNESPAYLRRFDVAIIPHLVNKFTKSMDPMKLYEYLVAGKPVVASLGGGIEDYKDYIYPAKDHAEFISQIEKAFSADNEQLAEAARQAVKHNSWENIVRKMLETVLKA